MIILDLDGFVGDFVGGVGVRYFEEGDGVVYVFGLLGVGYVVYLVINDDIKVSGMLWIDRWGKGGKGCLCDGF